MKKVTLYRLLYGIHDICPDAPILPCVPKNTMEGEDISIPRICTSSSLDGCLTGIGPSHIGLSALQEEINSGHPSIASMSFPFTVICFQIDRGDPALLSPIKISKYVPDALWAEEHWITHPIAPVYTSTQWLIGGTVNEDWLPFRGIQHRYLTISDSCWSKTPCCPDPQFKKAILKAANEYLLQN